MVYLEAQNKKRFRFFVLFFGIWAAVLTVRLFYFSVIKRESSLRAMESESLSRRRVSSLRGALYSASGQRLVYSKRIAVLCLKANVEYRQLSDLMLEVLQKELGIPRALIYRGLLGAGNRGLVIIKEKCTRHDLELLARYLLNDKSFLVRMKASRLYDVQALKRYGRSLKKRLSVFEQKYNNELAGHDWIYEEMLDKNGQAIPETHRDVQEFKSGQDVFLTESEWP
ncbi:MAG: hypothetical protein HRT88_14810 [Lentisphaeraceae bacterium]|nr:hypothetical protein [Lentisphaeraceae bacterium]